MAMAATAPKAEVQRIAVVSPSGSPLRQLRDVLFGEMVSRGHRVLAVAPEFARADLDALSALGAEHAVFAGESGALKLLADWRTIAGLKQALADWKPDVVLARGGPTMVYGALAAKAAGAARTIVVVDGLPEHRFTGPIAADEMPAWRYGQALRAADAAVFHNRDDLALLKRLGVVPPALPATVLPGFGVELERYGQMPLPTLGQGLVFLMIGGLDRRRGVMEYCEAAGLLRHRAPNCRFMLAVLPDEGAQAIDMAELARNTDVEYLGLVAEPADLLAEAHVFVYPAYAEGMPEPLLQALAAGRPVVTTNIAGCREAVDERVNGVLVPPRDAEALAEAMESFLRRPDLIPAMARASRGKAERFASTAAVRRSLLELMQVD